MSENIFKNKVVIVTGAGSGIGRFTARRYAQEGGKVCVADINLKGAEETVKMIREVHGEAFACKVDVSSEKDNDGMVEATVDQFGGLDIVVLNAGIIGEYTSLLESNVENFDRLYSINQRGCYLGIKSAAKVIRPEGAIVVVSSAAGIVGWNYSVAYSATKHAIIGLVRSSARELATKRVRINAVCPSVVETTMLGPNRGVDIPLFSPSELKMGDYQGIALPQQIAEVILFISSSRASFVTGGVFAVDGGLTCEMPPLPECRS
jgi:NAD(P)-dependent dehydrogenase (short-subunit alcohol dehydrogenase family)